MDKQEQDWVRGVLGVFVGLAWLRARVPGGELFNQSKELCELGLVLSQLERVWARLRLPAADSQTVQLVLLAPEELSARTKQQRAKW